MTQPFAIGGSAPSVNAFGGQCHTLKGVALILPMPQPSGWGLVLDFLQKA
jgi:hypothetical protein